MPVHSLFPAYIKLAYHSAYGAHNMILPTREWFAAGLTGDLGSFENWSSLPVDAEAMITDLCNAFIPFYPASCAFDTATVYTLENETAPARPRKTVALGIVGTYVGALVTKAVQHTYIFRDEEFNMSKLVMLDCIAPGSWDALSDLSGSATAQEIVDTFTAPGYAFASRAGFRPQSFVKITYKLNDELRKQYGMD
jgi:hypothetical protein